ncbi:hypothetical protein RSAG8_12003, partial [Rhizoctonia solani AG-8 WAC10335]
MPFYLERPDRIGLLRIASTRYRPTSKQGDGRHKFEFGVQAPMTRQAPMHSGLESTNRMVPCILQAQRISK